MFLSIHQITDAARVCDRFVLLSGGASAAKARSRSSRRSPRPAGAPATGDLEEVFLALT